MPTYIYGDKNPIFQYRNNFNVAVYNLINDTATQEVVNILWLMQQIIIQLSPIKDSRYIDDRWRLSKKIPDDFKQKSRSYRSRLR